MWCQVSVGSVEAPVCSIDLSSARGVTPRDSLLVRVGRRERRAFVYTWVYETQAVTLDAHCVELIRVGVLGSIGKPTFLRNCCAFSRCCSALGSADLGLHRLEQSATGAAPA